MVRRPGRLARVASRALEAAVASCNAFAALARAVALIGLAASANAEIAPVPGAALAERLERVVAGRHLRGAQVGALVVSRADGRVLYAHEPDRALVPASNQKVLTALAALRAFGPTHRFTTRIAADAAPDAAGAVRTLYVRGSGDPSLASDDWWRLAGALRAAGLRRVEGDLVLDDAAFDAVRWHPAWGPISCRAYYAPIGALSANQGAFAVELRPGAAGAPAHVAIEPPLPFFAIVNRTGTGGVRRGLVVGCEAAPGGETVVVSGTLAPDAAPVRVARSVGDPTRYAGAVLAWQLGAHGIEVRGSLRRGVVPEAAIPLLDFEGRPLAEIVRLLMKYSNNAIAEALVKAMGAARSGPPGTWDNGVAALAEHLAALGIPLDGARLIDGSGLARTNRVTPRLLVAALRAADRHFAIAPEFEASLPIAASDGTLERRGAAIAGHVRAKTGTLGGVAALSGYAWLGNDAGEAVFSVLVNDAPAGDVAAMAAVDAFAAALVGDPPGGSPLPPPLPSGPGGRQESVRRAR